MSHRSRGPTPGPYIDSVLFLADRVDDPEYYAFRLPALHGLAKLDLHPRVTFFVGENGSGKSTLLEAIAVAEGLNPEGGSRNFNFNTRPSHSKLSRILRLRRPTALAPDAWFLRAESLFNVATEIEDVGVQEAYGGVSLHEQSHGEAFFALIENRFDQGLYFMDEPEAALSPQRQLSFLVLLHKLVQQGSQLVIATHSPILMSYPDAMIYSFTATGVKPIEYEETEHYRVTRSFLESPSRMLRQLLADDDEA